MSDFTGIDPAISAVWAVRIVTELKASQKNTACSTRMESAVLPIDSTASMSLLARLTSDAVLDCAYAWLCHQRRRWPDASDVWSLRRNWTAEKTRLQADLRSGRFRLGLQERVMRVNGEEIDLWSARDALVLKALALVLGEHLPISRQCVHHSRGKK